MTSLLDKTFEEFFNSCTRFTYVWQLGDSAKLPKVPGQFLISPTFSDPNGQTRWHIRLTYSLVRSEAGNKTEWFMVHLYLESPHQVKANVFSAMGCKVTGHGFYVGDSQEVKFDCEKMIHRFKDLYECHNFTECFGLSLVCKIQLVEVVSSGEEWLATAAQLTMARSLKHCGEPDLVLVAKEVEIPTHRLVLCAVSPVFASMFGHPTQERQENRVVINDIEPYILRYLLDFIYDDSHGNLPTSDLNIIESMMIAADKYLMSSVVVGIAQKYIQPLLSADSATRVLIISERHQLKHLQRCVVELIRTDPLQVITQDDFIEATQQHTELITKLLKSLAESSCITNSVETTPS